MIWPKVIGPTVLSALTDVQLGGKSLKVPANAKTLLAIIPHLSSPAGNTAGEPIAAKFSFSSDDVSNIKPYTVLGSPIGSSLLKSVAQFKGYSPVYPVNCPVKSGNSFDVYAKGLFDHTIEPYASATLLYADYAVGPQYHAKVGTFTNTGASAGEAHDTTLLTITGGQLIKEVGSVVVGTTVAALKGILGKFRISSSGFGRKAAGLTGMGDIEWAIEGISGQVDTNIQECALLTRVGKKTPLDIPIEDPVDLDIYFNLGVALTTTGNFIAQVLYV